MISCDALPLVSAPTSGRLHYRELYQGVAQRVLDNSGSGYGSVVHAAIAIGDAQGAFCDPGLDRRPSQKAQASS